MSERSPRTDLGILRWRIRYLAYWYATKRRDYTIHPAPFKRWKRDQILTELTRMSQQFPGGYR